MTKQEREEVFLVCVLLPEERELYRKYGHFHADDLPTDSGIPNLRARMRDIFHRLVCAGMFDDDLPMPYEHLKDGVDVVSYLLRFEWQDGCPFLKCHFDFAVLKGGRVICYDAVPWWEVVERLYEDKRLGGWPMDDKKIAVRLYVGQEWCEVHERSEMPSILESFKAEIKKYLQDVWTDGDGNPCELECVTFPIYERVVFEVNCLGGLKVYCPSERDDKEGWVYLEVIPITESSKGQIAQEGKRSLIRR